MTTMRLERIAILVFCGWLILILMAALAPNLRLVPSAQAANFNIDCGNTTALINAIDMANGNSEADTINLAAGCTYSLTVVNNGTNGPNGLPSITSKITINGNGATIERNGVAPDFRIFHVAAGGDLALNALTVSNGQTSLQGGSILNNGGAVRLANSVVSGNRAGDGGGIFNDNKGTVTLANSVVSNNVANISGGGVKNDNDGILELTNSTVSSNTAVTIDGGGIDNVGTAQLTNSVVSGNHAGRDGGGIDNFGGDLVTLVNSTISGNQADFGGGIANQGKVELTNSTVASNSADSEGGGIKNFFASSTVELINTIVAGQTLGTDCHGIPVTSKGHNLDSDGSCGFTAPGDQTADPLLGPLQDNGGPTKTHALLPGSPAIDAVDDSACPPTDQRGVTRPRDGDGNGLAICDIGAFEKEEPTAITLISFTAHPAIDHVTLSWQTGTEIDNAGFNLYRATAVDDFYTKLNDALISAEGDPVSGASYTYIDTRMSKGVTYYYKLEDVDFYGVSTFHGPVSVTLLSIRSAYLPIILK